MVTANHILGHFFAFVAMGIGVFHSFVFCEKRVLLPPLPCLAHQNVQRMRGGLLSATEHQEKASVLGTGCKVTLFKLSPRRAGPSAVVATPAVWGGDAEHKARFTGPGGPAPPALGVRSYQTLPD